MHHEIQNRENNEMVLYVVTIADDGAASGVLRITIFIMTQLDMRSTLPTGKQQTADELALNSVVDPSYCISYARNTLDGGSGYENGFQTA